MATKSKYRTRLIGMSRQLKEKIGYNEAIYFLKTKTKEDKLFL